MRQQLLRVFLISTFLILSFGSKAQIYLDVDTYDPNNSSPKEYFTSEVLPTGETFELTIQGTYSAWAPSYWSSPCGNVENTPQYPSPSGNSTGKVGFDPEYIFALPTSSICQNYSLPSRTTKIEVSTDNGLTWFHPANNEAYTSTHIYHYSIIGQGFPLGVRQSAPYTSDTSSKCS